MSDGALSLRLEGAVTIERGDKWGVEGDFLQYDGRLVSEVELGGMWSSLSVENEGNRWRRFVRLVRHAERVRADEGYCEDFHWQVSRWNRGKILELLLELYTNGLYKTKSWRRTLRRYHDASLRCDTPTPEWLTSLFAKERTDMMKEKKLANARRKKKERERSQGLIVRDERGWHTRLDEWVHFKQRISARRWHDHLRWCGRNKDFPNKLFLEALVKAEAEGSVGPRSGVVWRPKDGEWGPPLSGRNR